LIKLPNRITHNRHCKDSGIDKKICDVVNEWMDEPIKDYPGCRHRNYRHSSKDCRDISKRGRNSTEIHQYFNACQIHRDLDRKYNGCGCSPLYDKI